MEDLLQLHKSEIPLPIYYSCKAWFNFVDHFTIRLKCGKDDYRRQVKQKAVWPGEIKIIDNIADA
jgi:hypothetical protein